MKADQHPAAKNGVIITEDRAYDTRSKHRSGHGNKTCFMVIGRGKERAASLEFTGEEAMVYEDGGVAGPEQ